jgi:hypothetical protein
MPTHIPTGGHPSYVVVSPDGMSFVIVVNHTPVYWGRQI